MFQAAWYAGLHLWLVTGQFRSSFSLDGLIRDSNGGSAGCETVAVLRPPEPGSLVLLRFPTAALFFFFFGPSLCLLGAALFWLVQCLPAGWDELVGVACVTQLLFLHQDSCQARPGPGLGLYPISSLKVGGFSALWSACCLLCNRWSATQLKLISTKALQRRLIWNQWGLGLKNAAVSGWSHCGSVLRWWVGSGGWSSGLLPSDIQTKDQLNQQRKATSKRFKVFYIKFQVEGSGTTWSWNLLRDSTCWLLCLSWCVSLFGLKETCELSRRMNHLLVRLLLKQNFSYTGFWDDSRFSSCSRCRCVVLNQPPSGSISLSNLVLLSL